MAKWTTAKRKAAPLPPAVAANEPVELDRAALDQLRFVGTDGICVLTKLIAAFSATTPDRIQSLGRPIADGDAVDVRLIAHTLKSSCAWFGAAALSHRFVMLEAAARAGRTEEWEPALAAIQREVPRLVAALQAVDSEQLTASATTNGLPG